MANKSEIIRVLDVLLDDPQSGPDMNVISQIAAGSSTPIGLLQDVVYLLWLCAERPLEFDEAVVGLYE